jgi:hypothetical protein
MEQTQPQTNKTLENELIEKYIISLNDIEQKGLTIAKEQLESSFTIEKSIGFLEFKKSQTPS